LIEQIPSQRCTKARIMNGDEHLKDGYPERLILLWFVTYSISSQSHRQETSLTLVSLEQVVCAFLTPPAAPFPPGNPSHEERQEACGYTVRLTAPAHLPVSSAIAAKGYTLQFMERKAA